MRGRRGWVAAFLIGVAVATAGCTASEPSPPSGVDGLTIPTPDPTPDDFVAAVDNAWLPLPAGARWEYDVTEDTGVHRLVVTTEPGPEVLGVATTARRQEPERKKSPIVPATDYYAQDRAGNVWWFGREGEWRAGEAGAEAGLVMPAEPRFGDGFRMAVAPGLDVRAEVVELDRDAGLLELAVHRGELLRDEQYVEGVGLRGWEVPDFGMSARLVAHDLDG